MRWRAVKHTDIELHSAVKPWAYSTAFCSRGGVWQTACLIKAPGGRKITPPPSWDNDLRWHFEILRDIWSLDSQEIAKFVATTRCQILRLKCSEFDLDWGSASDPAPEAYSKVYIWPYICFAYSASRDPLPALRGPTSKRGKEIGRQGKAGGGALPYVCRGDKRPGLQSYSQYNAPAFNFTV